MVPPLIWNLVTSDAKREANAIIRKTAKQTGWISLRHGFHASSPDKVRSGWSSPLPDVNFLDRISFHIRWNAGTVGSKTQTAHKKNLQFNQ